MPPIMGAVAFIMAEVLGISYLRVAAGAVIPSFLYFLGVGMIVHFEAHKMRLPAMSEEELPDKKKIWRRAYRILAKK